MQLKNKMVFFVKFVNESVNKLKKMQSNAGYDTCVSKKGSDNYNG